MIATKAARWLSTLCLGIVVGFVAPPAAWAASAPQPGEGKLDWIRLRSGEWLAGELKFLRNESLEFDSDKLDLLQFKWEDVIELRCSRTLTFVFTEKRVAIGPASIRDSVVRVREGAQEREFRLHELVSIIAGQGRERDLWSGKLSLGFVGRSGNTNQVDINTLGSVRREGTASRVDLRYVSNYGMVESVRSVDNQLGTVRYDLFLSPRLFVTPASVELSADEFQNIALRTMAFAGMGVFFVKRGDLEWFVQLGAGYLSTRYRSVTPGEDLTDVGASLVPLTAVEWEPVKDLKLNVKYQGNMNIPDLEKFFHQFYSLLSIKNLKVVDFDMSLTWDHAAQPKRRDDGTLPLKDDVRTTVGIGIDF